MIVADIYNHIRTLSHDRGLVDGTITFFINQAIAEIKTRGYLKQQVITDELITVADGTTAIVPSLPVKSILECDADYTKDSQGLRLLEAANGDTDITLSYVSEINNWDGSEVNNVLDEWLYIYGGAYYACMHNMSPETSIYRQHFDNHIGRVFGDDTFLDGVEDAMSNEILGL